jgi:hypothetical protein
MLTRLPGEFRLTGPEAKQLIESTIKLNMRIFPHPLFGIALIHW